MAQHRTTSHDWREAGEAWGDRATDWAYLFEPYARSANQAVLDQLAVAEGARMLDIACGSGFAAHLASERGAAVSGVDASEGLVTIARARTPQGDFRVGDMFALPFPDASFDAATSFNGIWKGCESALLEARRVLVRGGRIGLTFWGPFEHLGLMPYFIKVIELSEASHATANMEHGDTQNVIEDMLEATGFERLERGTVTVVNEWPDTEIAVRALVSAGPSVPAIRTVGLDAFCDALRSVIEPMHVPGVGIRVTSVFDWITARAQ
jgi:ubiquinone/menaquinone biosynthesis C-methylase UbiE